MINTIHSLEVKPTSKITVYTRIVDEINSHFKVSGLLFFLVQPTIKSPNISGT